jgi:hypothetical protein
MHGKMVSMEYNFMNKFFTKSYRISIGLLATLICGGCSSNYNVMLAIDSKEYKPDMTWVEVREVGYRPVYRHCTLKVVDNDGRAVPLYRYAHEENRIIPLDEAEIHISTPIIVDKKYTNIFLEVFNNGVQLSKVSVVISNLKWIKGKDKALVVPLDLPFKN